jgi:hypothetical protein
MLWPVNTVPTRVSTAAESLLTANWREGQGRSGARYAYTCPDGEKYPYQWFWDSLMHALAWNEIAPARAADELRSLAAAQAEALAVQTPGNTNGAPPPTPPTAVEKAVAAASAADAESLRRELKDAQRALREARQSLNFAHSEEGKTHLKSVLAKYIEVDDGILNSDGPFEVLCTVLGYSAEEKQRMVAARRRKKEASAGLWGRVVGS